MVSPATRDQVMSQAEHLTKCCHPTVAEKHRGDLARYARIHTACGALESFLGCRPMDDEDVFGDLAARRRQLADVLAMANFSARIAEAPPGLYLGIPYFYNCSNEQPLFLINRTEDPVTYLGRKLYAFASTDDGIDEYQTSGSAFADGIASVSELRPGDQIKIQDYSMSFDGDFISHRRVFLLVDSARTEWLALVNKLGGHFPGSGCDGIHLLACRDPNHKGAS